MNNQLLQACVEAIDENILDGRVVIGKAGESFVIDVMSGFERSERKMLRIEKPRLDDAIHNLARWVVDRMAPGKEPTQNVRMVRLLLQGSM